MIVSVFRALDSLVCLLVISQSTYIQLRVHIICPCLLDRRDGTVREGSNLGCGYTRLRSVRGRPLPFPAARMGRCRSHVQCDHVLLQALHPTTLPSPLSNCQFHQALVDCNRLYDRILNWRRFCFAFPMQSIDLCLVFDCQGRLLHQHREVLYRQCCSECRF
jgi:hypothetical protein